MPLVECVWGFPGGGTDYPLEPGGQAVMCINGAIDHTLQYPLSVDLNRADCFVCYDNTYYTNTTYHPTPGDKVRTDRYMQVLRKTGRLIRFRSIRRRRCFSRCPQKPAPPESI